MAKFTLKDYLKDRDVKYPKDFAPYKDNADRTVLVLNKFLANYPGQLVISSGFRPAALNNSVKGAATKSNHITCQACDFQDLDLKLWKYVLDNLDLAKALGIYFEDKRWTSSWVHMQIVPSASGKRIYIPNSNPADRPDLWSGTYDKKYDGK
jgi:uncharacterized protein YcbK (DUF882 family)